MTPSPSPPGRPADWHAPIMAAVARAYWRARRRQPIYWEIGVLYGDSIRELAPFCRQVVGVDIDLSGLNRTNLSRVDFLEMRSDEFFERVAPKLDVQPDIVFIDGDHTAEQVTIDAKNALRFLAPSGTLFMHDTRPDTVADTDPRICGGAFEVPRMLADDPALAVWTLPIFPGLTAVSRAQEGPAIDVPDLEGQRRCNCPVSPGWRDDGPDDRVEARCVGCGGLVDA